MKIDSIVANLRAILRANSIIADIHARHLVARTSLTGFAALIGAFGLLMLGVAGYLALESVVGAVWAAVSVGLANCAIALVLVLVASRIRPGRDLELAREVHRTAVEALISDGRALESEIGVRLLSRSGQKVQPTEAGAAILVPARDLLGRVRDLRSIAASDNPPPGTRGRKIGKLELEGSPGT